MIKIFIIVQYVSMFQDLTNDNFLATRGIHTAAVQNTTITKGKKNTHNHFSNENNSELYHQIKKG